MTAVLRHRETSAHNGNVAMRLLVSPHELRSMFSLLWPLLLAFTLPQLVFFPFYAWDIRHSFDQCH